MHIRFKQKPRLPPSHPSFKVVRAALGCQLLDNPGHHKKAEQTQDKVPAGRTAGSGVPKWQVPDGWAPLHVQMWHLAPPIVRIGFILWSRIKVWKRDTDIKRSCLRRERDRMKNGKVKKHWDDAQWYRKSPGEFQCGELRFYNPGMLNQWSCFRVDWNLPLDSLAISWAFCQPLSQICHRVRLWGAEFYEISLPSSTTADFSLRQIMLHH